MAAKAASRGPPRTSASSAAAPPGAVLGRMSPSGRSRWNRAISEPTSTTLITCIMPSRSVPRRPACAPKTAAWALAAASRVRRASGSRMRPVSVSLTSRVATASNLGGIGVGPLGAGLLAQFVPLPLVIPYVIFGGVLVVLALLIAFAPETGSRPDPRPAWRPQRVTIPAHARGTFFAAMGAAAAAFAVYGVFNSLMPGFLAGTMHETSYAVAGAVAFSAFAAGAVAQIARGTASIATTLKVSVPVLFAGLALFTVGMWLPSLPVFVIGGIVTGAGGGLVFRGSLVAAASTAPPESRAEVLAGFFLGAYIGLSAPVIALGVATEYLAARDVMLVFVVLAAIAIAAGARAVLHHSDRH